MTARKWIRLLALLLIVAALLPVNPVRAESAERLTIERQVYAYLTGQMGLNSAAACGIMANIEVESDFSLTALGDSGTSFGLCQWHEGRYAALISYCGARGKDYRTLMGQLEYLHYELRTSYANLYAQLRQVENTAQGAYQAGYLWCVKFERPADMEIKGVTRGNLAQYKYWNRYQGLTLPQPEDTQSFTVELLQESGNAVNHSITEWTLDSQAQAEEPADTEEPENSSAETHRARIKAYVPHHRPVEETDGTAVGIAMGLQFVVLGDGREHRRFRLPEPEAEDVPEPAA